MSNRTYTILFLLLLSLMAYTYFFAMDFFNVVLLKTRDGLSLIGAGTVLYWFYLLLK
jgi:hypothetical protein